MGNKTTLEILENKISLLLEKFEFFKKENYRLEETLRSCRETEARLHQEILKLKEEDEMKELELEDIALRISKSMGLKEEEHKILIAS